jgi:ABC-type multidrug transport system ATPase subunit
MIEVRGLTRWFGGTCAVRNLSLAVPAGSVLGFIGPNGAGKTTTMRILATLDEPDLGDALVDGFSVVDDAVHTPMSAASSTLISLPVPTAWSGDSGWMR